jgi:NAD(P)-dependent dehydrogenase (short-subunit alcohol dehydrogenase family)
MDDSRQFLEGRRPQDGEKAPKYAPIGYCDSKMMNEVYARELAKRHPEVSVISIGPGWCKTDLARNVDIPWYKKFLLAPIALMFIRSVEFETRRREDVISALGKTSVFLRLSGVFQLPLPCSSTLYRQKTCEVVNKV